MNIKNFYRLSTIAFLVAGTALVNAQTSSSNSDASEPAESAQLESQPPDLPPQHWEMTVTATRTPTSAREIGQSLTILTGEDIEAQGARDVLQILETVPGFSVTRTGSFGGTTSVFVRGGENDFNLVLIDGVQVNQPGGAFDFANLSTTNIERIEIVRGPASVLYGADAVTSVINIITRKGEGKPTGRFRFEGGTHDTYLLQGDIQGGSDAIRYSFGAHYSQSEGLHELNNDYDRLELSANTTLKLSSSSSISANARFTDSEYHFPTDSIGLVVDPNDFRQADEFLFSAAYENFFTNRYSTTIHYGFYRMDSESFTVQDDIVDFFESTFEVKENRNYLDWENNFQLSPNNLMTTGLSWEHEESEAGDLSRRSVGVYLQEQLSWAERFFLTAGVRYDNNNQFKSFATASASLGYLINDQLKLRTSLGNGFRAPNSIEIIGFPQFGILGNANLDPEKNLAVDFGFDFFSRSGRGGLSATAFFNRFSDLIEFSFLVPPDTPNYVNVEKARSRGLELDGSIRLTERFRVGAQYTLTNTKVTDAGTIPGGGFVEGEELLRRPKHTAGLFAEFLRNRYRFRIDFKYKGTRDDLQFFPDFSNSRVVLPSYWKVDFGVTVPLVKFGDSPGDVALAFRGENIFNQHYTEIAGFESLGRTVFAGLEVAF